MKNLLKSDRALIYYFDEDTALRRYKKIKWKGVFDRIGVASEYLLPEVFSAFAEFVGAKDYIYNYTAPGIFKSLEVAGVAIYFVIDTDSQHKQLANLLTFKTINFLIVSLAQTVRKRNKVEEVNFIKSGSPQKIKKTEQAFNNDNDDDSFVGRSEILNRLVLLIQKMVLEKQIEPKTNKKYAKSQTEHTETKSKIHSLENKKQIKI